MTIRRDDAVLRQLRTLFNVGTTGTSTDGQLLERFATGLGEAPELAFAALVERHGPLVLRVCRAVLRDESGVDVEFFYYPADHAFHNDKDRLGTYDEESAKLAWSRTVDFLRARVS